MKVIWFTGLSGSGKTTLAKEIKKKLKKKNYKIKLIDGDIFRKKTGNKNNFTKINIIRNNLKIINYIENIQKKYDFIIISVISPLLKTRKIAKKKFGNNYLEIFTKCKIKELIKRDTKGMYKLANEKKIQNLIGYNSRIIYEKSNYKILTINTDRLSKLDSVKKIFRNIK
tara:strand:+ start:185 stop:694 length:510 start_codon:yes stop_codon:yes gene_type:complete